MNPRLSGRWSEPSAAMRAALWAWTETEALCGCLPRLWGHSLPLELQAEAVSVMHAASETLSVRSQPSPAAFPQVVVIPRETGENQAVLEIEGRSVCLLTTKPSGRYLSHRVQFEVLKFK